MSNTKIITYYLPQFHRIPENDAWWGEGFTEWTNMKKAKPLYDGHYQPRIPLNNNYYNLLDEKTLEWQSELAEKYGIYGFCFYHYWFHGRLLLEKPMELYRQNDKCKTKYCICWANENWTNAWATKDETVLMKQDYSDTNDWVEHFNYLLPHFKSDKYICIDNKPLVVIYSTHIIPDLGKRLKLWNDMAIENGFEGLTFFSQSTYSILMNYKDKNMVSRHIEYQPQLGYTELVQKRFKTLRSVKRVVSQFMLKHFSIDIASKIVSKASEKETVRHFDYDMVWQKILEHKPSQKGKYVPGAFVDWDNTPRKENRGFVIEEATPDKFAAYLKKQLERAKSVYESDYLFLFAWNEWAEGGYIEPDERYQYGYLEAIRACQKEQ